MNDQVPEKRPPEIPRAGGAKRNLFLTFGANIAILVLTVATGTLNARLLGPSGRGELAAIQTVPSVLGMIALLGLPSAVGYFSARRPTEARPFTVTGALICLIASVPAMVVGYLIMPWVLASQPAAVVRDARVYLIFIGLQALVQLPFMALQGLGKFAVWNVLRVAPNIGSLAVIVAACATGVPNSGRFSRFYLVMYCFLIPLVYGVLWANTKGGSGSSIRVNRAGELLKYGLPSALMIPAGLVNYQLDQMMMAAWLPSKMLGLYVVSVSWSGLMSPVFGALGSIIFPTLAAARDGDAQRLLVARSLRLAVLVVLVLGAGLALITPIFLPLFFGASFSPAVPVALVLVAASMVLNLNNLCGEILRGLGVPRWPLYGQIAALPFTIGLLLVLLPRLSILGAGLSSLAAYLVAGIVCVEGVRRTCGIGIRELLLPKREEGVVLWNVIRGILSRRPRENSR